MLRHVCASWLGQMQGVEALTIRDLLGHSSVTMTDRYMHGDQADLHDAVHKLGNFRSHSGHTDLNQKGLHIELVIDPSFQWNDPPPLSVEENRHTQE